MIAAAKAAHIHDFIQQLPEQYYSDLDEKGCIFPQLDCPYLGEHGCEVYDERPLIHRLFSTTPSLLCPNACGPAHMTDPKVEQQIHELPTTLDVGVS